MAWEWSHTIEAYDNVRANLGRLPNPAIACIYAEWLAIANPEHYAGGFNPRVYRRTYTQTLKNLTLNRGLDRETLESIIYDRASDSVELFGQWYGRTCDNGGWNAYVCPWGCHTVPFDPPNPNPEPPSEPERIGGPFLERSNP